MYSHVYGLKTICLRYFNVYGPRQNPHSEYAAVIPQFVIKTLNGKPPIIYGDGRQTRDFAFVKDVVKANILAMESDTEGVFNIANGLGISINDLAFNIIRIAGKELEPIYEKPRPGEITDSLADISAAEDILGYRPDFNLISGLEETFEWFLRNGLEE
jgi:UDP-glucose 4-epimerase